MAAFTTIATGLSIGAQVYSGIKSGKQAKKARKKQKKADQAAKQALQTAREDLDVNFYDSLSVNTDPYNQERDALLSTSANIMDSAIQADQRGIGASAQSILAASQKAQQSVTKRLNKELENIELLKASEDARLRDEMAKTYLEEAKGAGQAAQAYGEQAATARQNQAESFASAGQQLLEAAPLYGDLGFGDAVDYMSKESRFARQVGRGMEAFETPAYEAQMDELYDLQNQLDEEIVYNTDGSILYDPNE